jgi:hypothetical protein
MSDLFKKLCPADVPVKRGMIAHNRPDHSAVVLPAERVTAFGVGKAEVCHFGRNKMRTFTNLVLALTVVSMVAACGSSRTDRTLSGAGIGAAGGAAVGAVTGGNPLTGAILGGAAGAAVGGLTDEDDFNLGDPIWD